MSTSTESETIRLTYREKVPVATMKETLQQCLQDKLTGAHYDGEQLNSVAKQLADTIRTKLKGLGYDRYKFIVQVLIGERRDQGVRMGTKCFWDSGTDNQATENFMNDNIFAVATAYAVYLY